ncbi:MAG: sugar ABC transporter permease [Oscillospiraceae bacterium]|nr:sugar ABC transporter permease [Oscillospiraceae bacterium]
MKKHANGSGRLPDRQLKSVSYAKWGYFFIIPFFVVYICFTLVPQFLTIYNSFFENYRDGLNEIGPNYVGLDNYETLFTADSSGTIRILKYTSNTMVMWFIGALPQFVIAMLLAIFFTSARLNIKGQGFFKTVIYMPNLIMAAAFSMLFFTLFSRVGPIQALLVEKGWIDASFDFFSHRITVRGMIAMMNFLMWFGNTTIVLMAGIMGIDQSLFESATLDGANAWQVFFRVTLPLLMPIFVYCLITAMIGGIQMFDVPQVLTKGNGAPNETTRTLVMYLNGYLANKNYGMAGAISVIIFIVTGALGGVVYRMLSAQYKDSSRQRRQRKGDVI